MGGGRRYTHFTDEEAEAQKDEGICRARIRTLLFCTRRCPFPASRDLNSARASPLPLSHHCPTRRGSGGYPEAGGGKARIAGKKRTRLGGRDSGDPPLRCWRCLCPWSKQQGNPPFSSARRAHSYSNHSAAGPRAATFPGPREPPSTSTFHLRSTGPGPLPLPHFQLRRGGVPGKASSPALTTGLLTNSVAGCGGPRGWRRGEQGDMGRGRGGTQTD